MKLSERFDELAREARTAARETLLGTYYEAQARAFERAAQLVAAHEKVRVVCGYCEAVLTDAPDAFAAHDTVCERNPLVKRVADLEESFSKERDVAIGLRNRVSELEDEAVLDVQLIDDQRATIADLQSQLAWTPVAEGLPTEPGVYEFLWLHKHPTVGCWRLTADGWVTRDGKPPTIGIPYTHYRRIELPEAS